MGSALIFFFVKEIPKRVFKKSFIHTFKKEKTTDSKRYKEQKQNFKNRVRKVVKRSFKLIFKKRDDEMGIFGLSP